MSTLSRDQLWDAMRADAHPTPLVVTPLLDDIQVGAASIDLRLGFEFIVFRRSSLTHVDPSSTKSIEERLHRIQEKLRVSRRERFVLHPQEFVLAATLEYVALPSCYEAEVTGRSTWGRVGLTVATATTVSPGFKGCITLELVNHGEVPIVLFPGIAICQLAVREVSTSAEYKGRYEFPTGPEFPKLARERDLEFWATRESGDSRQPAS